MNDENIKVCCSRCGSEMPANSRYCMKCGNLNENHIENQKYSKLIKKTNNTGYQVGSGKSLFNNDNKNRFGVDSVSSKNNNRLVFILVNAFLIFISCLIALLPLLSLEEYSVSSILSSGILDSLFIIGITSLLFVSFQVLFIKMDEYWWAALIPFYNYYVLSKAVFGNGWLCLLVLIPIVGEIYILVLLYKLGVAFGKSGIITILIPFVEIPIIAYGSSSFNGVYYVADYSKNALEKSYSSYNKFAKVSLFLIIVGMIGFAFNNGNLMNAVGNKDSVEAIAGIKVSINNVKKAVKNDKVSCTNDIKINQDGIYYFYSEDFMYDFGLKSNLIDSSQGYIKLVRQGGNNTYYVSYTNGENGIREVSEDNLKIDLFEKIDKIDEPSGILCTID